jgi:hypothetical protein
MPYDMHSPTMVKPAQFQQSDKHLENKNPIPDSQYGKPYEDEDKVTQG